MTRQRERPPEPPLVYRFVKDASAQSETFGVLLLLAITVVGTTAIVAFGSQALTDTERASEEQRTGHTMTLLDSRSAMVGLGESQMQQVDFSSSKDGSYLVDEDAGYIQVKHENFSADEDGDEIIYNASLGAFIYENGDTTIAYQGGGVWKIQDNGIAQMISQPEFHYRSSTLTFPIIRVKGEGSAAGRTTVTVSALGEPERVYPHPGVADTPGVNETGPPYNGSSGPDAQYLNPVESGVINITIHSEYYKGWAEYFRTRTDAKLWVWDSNETIRVKLEPLGVPGAFGNLNDKVVVRGMPDGHKVTDFTVNLTESTQGNNQFKEMHWSWHATSGSQKLEFYVDIAGQNCADIKDTSKSAPIEVSVFYQNGSGSQGDRSQEWRATVDNQAGSDDFIEKVTCPASGAESIVLNWTAANAPDLEFHEVDGNVLKINCGGNSGRKFVDDYIHCDGDSSYTQVGTAPMGQHSADFEDSECCGFTRGEHANLSYLVNHYMALLGPSYDLIGEEHNDNRLDEDESSGNLHFEQSGARYIQYLHVTENEVEFSTS